MTKLTIFIMLAILIISVESVPGPRVDSNGVIYISTVPGWSCTVTFNKKGVPVYSASLSAGNPSTDNHVMDPSNSDQLDTISWAGSSCNCWVEVFEDAYFEGESLGLWIGSTNGTIDLTLYNFLEDSDAVGDDDYAQWNTEVSSYRIYCF